jgi:molybdenum cofactor cytidylyltransferase
MMQGSPASPNPRIGCIVLAAGSSKRFGSDKRLYRLPSGTGVLQQTLENLLPLFRQRILVLRPDDTELAMQHGKDWQIVVAAQAGLGMGNSLAAAMQATRDWQGAVIALADMPWVLPATVCRVRDALTPDTIVVPTWQGRRGNPVGIGCDYFARLAALQGDSGARQLMQEFSARLVKLEIDDPGLVRDLDVRP